MDNLLMLAGMALLLVIMMRNLVKRSKKNANVSIKRQLRDVRKEFDACESRADTPLIDAPTQMSRWHVEMHETARDLKAEIDSKILVLQSTIQCARSEIERLESTIRKAKTV